MFTQTNSQIISQGADYGQLTVLLGEYVDEVEDFDIEAIVEDAASAIYQAALDAAEPRAEFDWDAIDLDVICARHQR